MLFSLVLTAVAAPPCTGLTSDTYVEGAHFWVQWDETVADEAEALQVLAWAEHARSVYTGLGWPITDETIAIRIEASTSVRGQCSTAECDDGRIIPVITLYSDDFGRTYENMTSHEVVHAFEYYHTETFAKTITSWAWWTEGTATWLTTHADGDLEEWRRDSRDYFEYPWIGLHQTPLAYVDPQLSDFLYGTAFIAQYIEDRHGVGKVLETWEYGAEYAGTPIYFPDAIEGVGLDWEDFWYDFMATAAVIDIPYGDDLATGTFIEKNVRQLPAGGSPKDARQPQGLGLSIVHFKSDLGEEGMDLVVSFEGDPSVEWLGLLMVADQMGPGSSVRDVVRMEISEGVGVASLPDFDGSAEAFLVVSPMEMSLDPHDYAWSAELSSGSDVGRKNGEDRGCGCDSTGGTLGWMALLVAMSASRRQHAVRHCGGNPRYSRSTSALDS